MNFIQSGMHAMKISTATRATTLLNRAANGKGGQLFEY